MLQMCTYLLNKIHQYLKWNMNQKMIERDINNVHHNIYFLGLFLSTNKQLCRPCLYYAQKFAYYYILFNKVNNKAIQATARC